jgi:hypothetical protein
MLVMRSIEQHEMRGGPADLCASHHQAETGGLDMLSAHFKAVRHRRAEARFVAA